MRTQAKATLATIAIAASLMGTGVAANASGATIVGEGSSYAGGILTACVADYNSDSTANSAGDVVSYTSSSSGAGRTSFTAGTKDFAASDWAYGDADSKPSDLLYVPLVGGPIAIAYNLPGIASGLKLDAPTLGSILRGDINTWNATAIARLNPSVKLPSANIIVNYRSGSSGTTQNLANYLMAGGASGWSNSGTWATATNAAAPVGNSEANSAALVSDTHTKAYSIGYADLKDTLGKGLTFAAIKNADGSFVLPTVAASNQFLGQQVMASNGLVSFKYFTKFGTSKTKSVAAIAKTAYNLSVVTYGLAHNNPSTANSAVARFFKYVLTTCAPTYAADLKYVPLSGKMKTTALTLVGKVG